ncbi:PAS domain-containing protein [Candidatus Acetothermia bacterium]|nr:PAS domain-containing protein [Candidatus Acetothermia bacterium]MBI3643659.1 PAS domain-containing protein [Candidatus Acetothermia bacterium]
MLSSIRLWKLLATVAIYALVTAILFGLHVRDIKLVFAISGIGFLLAALSWEILINVGLAALSTLIVLPLLPPSDSSLTLAGIYGLAAVALGLLIGWFNRKERVRHPKQEASRYYPEGIFQRAQNPMVIVDRTGRVLERNDRAVELLGSVKHFSEIIHFEDLERARVEMERAMRMGEASGFQLRGVTWDKETFPAEIRMRALDADQVWIELHDMSDLLEMERKLWEAEARYRHLIEDAIDTLDTGIVLLNKDRQIIWANQTIGHLFNLDRDEMIGVELHKILGQVRPNFIEEMTMPHVLEADNKSFVFALKHGEEERILEFRSTPIETEKYRGGRIDHYIDLTELKKLERELVEKTAGLEESNKKLEEFSHVVSHDLKQPLRTIQAFTQFIVDDYSEKLDAQGIDYLKSLQRSSARMKNLIDDLLKLASISTKRSPMEKIELCDVLAEVREDLGALLDGVQLEISPNFPAITANRTRTMELFANLISNGVKYNDKAQKRIVVEWEDRADEYIFRVGDNGIGIDMRYQDRIFELFERLNPVDDPESTGAGLAITKRIVSEMGGKIWVDSEIGKGSIFSFSVPKRSRMESRVHQHT